MALYAKRFPFPIPQKMVSSLNIVANPANCYNPLHKKTQQVTNFILILLKKLLILGCINHEKNPGQSV